MTKEQIQKGFSDIIWEAEISNQVLSEYLDSNPKVNDEWVALEEAAHSIGLSPFELAHK